jgi:hypothetical protein
MAPQAPTKEELAQVRRIRAQKRYVAPGVVAEGTSKTPKLTRFIIAKERRLKTLQSEAASVAFSSPNTGSATTPFEAKAPDKGNGMIVRLIVQADEFKLTANKTHFPTANYFNVKNTFAVVGGSILSLPHTPMISYQASRHFPRVKGRWNFYELQEDDSASAPALVREVSSAPDLKRSTITLCAKPNTNISSIPDTPSPQIQETRKPEECLKVPCKTRQGTRKEFYFKSQYPSQSASRNKITDEVISEPHELPLSTQQ